MNKDKRSGESEDEGVKMEGGVYKLNEVISAFNLVCSFIAKTL
jgi:hypothetical protein